MHIVSYSSGGVFVSQSSLMMRRGVNVNCELKRIRHLAYFMYFIFRLGIARMGHCMLPFYLAFMCIFRLFHSFVSTAFILYVRSSTVVLHSNLWRH